MAAGGRLINTHIRIGDSFLECVCPTDQAWLEGSAQTKILMRNGDCGYMAIVQACRCPISRPRPSPWGARVVPRPTAPSSPTAAACMPPRPARLWHGRLHLVAVPAGSALPKTEGGSVGANVPFHPKVFGTLAELQENWPGGDVFPRNKGAYLPVGNSWQNGVEGRPHGGVTSGFVAVEIAVDPKTGSPEAVCGRWARGIGAGCTIDAAEPTMLGLSGGQSMRVVAPSGKGRSNRHHNTMFRDAYIKSFHAILN